MRQHETHERNVLMWLATKPILVLSAIILFLSGWLFLVSLRGGSATPEKRAISPHYPSAVGEGWKPSPARPQPTPVPTPLRVEVID